MLVLKAKRGWPESKKNDFKKHILLFVAVFFNFERKSGTQTGNKIDLFFPFLLVTHLKVFTSQETPKHQTLN